MGTRLRLQTPDDLKLPPEDVALALELAANAALIVPRFMPEMPTQVVATREVSKHVWVERWVAARCLPVVPPGERQLFRAESYVGFWPRQIRMLSQTYRLGARGEATSALRAVEVRVADRTYAWTGEGKDVDLRAVGVPLMDVGACLELVVENGGHEPAIVRPVLVGDVVSNLLENRTADGVFRRCRGRVMSDDDVDIEEAAGRVQRGVPIGMEHGHRQRRFDLTSNTDAGKLVCWQALWHCRPQAFRVHAEHPEDLTLNVGHGPKYIENVAVTGDWQSPDGLGDITISLAAGLGFWVRSARGETGSVAIELRVTATEDA
jgi:hypothetical protein